MASRTYYATLAQAEGFLRTYGFTFLANNAVYLYNWHNSKTGNYAEVRFNSQGYFIEYRNFN